MNLPIILAIITVFCLALVALLAGFDVYHDFTKCPTCKGTGCVDAPPSKPETFEVYGKPRVECDNGATKGLWLTGQPVSFKHCHACSGTGKRHF